MTRCMYANGIDDTHIIKSQNNIIKLSIGYRNRKKPTERPIKEPTHRKRERDEERCQKDDGGTKQNSQKYNIIDEEGCTFINQRLPRI